MVETSAISHSPGSARTFVLAQQQPDSESQARRGERQIEADAQSQPAMNLLGSGGERISQQERSRAQRQAHHDESRLGAKKPRNEWRGQNGSGQDQSSQKRSLGHGHCIPNSRRGTGS